MRTEYLETRRRAGLPNELGELAVRELSMSVKKEEIIRVALLGFSTRKIAENLGITPATVRCYLCLKDVQEAIISKNAAIWARIDDEITASRLTLTERIDNLSSRALEKIAALLESDDERVSLKAATDVLDRNPETSKTHKVETRSLTMTLSPEQLMIAAQAAHEMDQAKPVKSESPIPTGSSSIIDGVVTGIPE